jgi:hypothetical protein
MFPAGSTLQQSDSFPPLAETWIVPLAPAEEIANLRVQLPVDKPFDDGRPWCSKHSLPAQPGAIKWSWGTPQAEAFRQDFLAVAVTDGGVNISEVRITLHLMNREPGCP